jgi:hypothetical protein
MVELGHDKAAAVARGRGKEEEGKGEGMGPSFLKISLPFSFPRILYKGTRGYSKSDPKINQLFSLTTSRIPFVSK